MKPAGRDCATCAVKETGCFCTLTAQALTNLQGIGGYFKAGERVLDEGEAAERVNVLRKGRMKLSSAIRLWSWVNSQLLRQWEALR